MLISIVVPVYNVAEYLPRCLDSLIAQTYPEIEIIAIDDGSTDESGRILDEYATCDNRVRAVHIANAGVSNARNIGLDMAKGDYIGFVDSDDWIDADMYERLAAAMTDNVDVVCGGYVLETEQGQKYDMLRVNEPKVYRRIAALCEVFDRLDARHAGWALWDKLFKKELIQNVRFDTAIVNSEDMLFFWDVMCRCKDFALVPIYGYHYYMRPSSMVHNPLTAGYITAWAAWRQVLGRLGSEPKELRDNVIKYALLMAINIGKIILRLDVGRYANIMQEIQSVIRGNIIQLMTSPLCTTKAKLGAIYFLLPLPTVRAMWCIVKHVCSNKYL